ncbi:MAG: PKD domain-containing protein [Sedimentisphaerales bacterium]
MYAKKNIRFLIILLSVSSLLLSATAAKADQNVVLRVVDQFGVDIPASTIQVQGQTVPTGSSILLPEGTYVFTVIPANTHPALLSRTENAAVLNTTTELAFEWITSEVTLRMEDQSGVEIPGTRFKVPPFGDQIITGDVLAMPITDENVYPTISGNYIDGYDFDLLVGTGGSIGHPARLHRTEGAKEVTETTTEITFEWITSEVTIRLEDQWGVEIPGSRFKVDSYGDQIYNDDVLTFPITDETVYPTMGGYFTDGYDFDLLVGLGGAIGHPVWLHRTEGAKEVTETTTDIVFEWIQHQCALELRDTAYQTVSGSTVVLPSPFPSYTHGEVTTFPINDDIVYPGIAGNYADGYPITVEPGDIAPTSATIYFTALASGEFDPAMFDIGGNTYRLGCGPAPTPVEIVDGSLTASPLVAQLGDVIAFEASIMDGCGQIDAIWDYDDGNSDWQTDVTSPGLLTAAHTYSSAGVYTVMLGVADDCHTVGENVVVVVYDPSGGFVTGAGWIDSPEGAYKPDPSAAGKASFGFVSRYKQGATTPTGNTEFVFHAGDLHFQSSSYDWLVVNQGGSNAQFKGTGSLNGSGQYRFMLWAGDGEPDTFRIRIWEEDVAGSELDVYDNGFNQQIGGGEIVIHTN